MADQAAIDKARRQMAEVVVDAQGCASLDEARRFAIAWIVTAAQNADNADYWRERCHKAESAASSSGTGSAG